MKLKHMSLVVAAVVGGMAAWLFISPIFIDENVDEPLLPVPIETSMPTRKASLAAMGRKKTTIGQKRTFLLLA